MSTSQTNGNRSAGIGDPYWYEWGIGLLKAVEMLNPDSGIDAVAFQKAGIKGWDDVVVRLDSGHEDYYQVKHSRPRTNLTTSDLIGRTDDEPSLLESLASSWHEMGLSSKDSGCILVTNRSAGTQAGRSRAGTYHPPLAEMISHIAVQTEQASKLADISMRSEWQDAWTVWQTEMGSISDDEKLQFLKQLTISTDAPQLEEMRDRLAESLASSFQITKPQAAELVQRLLSALFNWTTSMRGSDEWITAEDVMTAIAESDTSIFGLCDVPTPTPFFPSREQTVDDICSLLTGAGEHRVVFVEAEPGSGKTCAVSRIVNQRVEDYSALVVDLRYYAYKPITPDAPTLPADADQTAAPESLWHTLLSQIRERLKGRLRELRVPVRNGFTTPEEARDHVLRLAAVLAEEKGAPFVIAIDGIDHAARAARKGLPSLLRSLPVPETVPEGVRLLIAGQPASAYPEYPVWLRNENSLVKQSGLGAVDTADVQLLLSQSSTSIPAADHEHAARVIQGVADGNTLATVFAVAEAEACASLADLEGRLADRQLHSGVHTYYTGIWKAAIPDSPVGLGAYLSSVLCLLRERITGTMMQNAFPLWEKSAPEWDAILRNLEPLVIRDTDGFRVRHNDIRVFLEQELRADETSMQQVASLLADYYMTASAPALFAQQSLFFLLQLAGREQDKARIFTPKWVLDAVAHGRELATVYQEAEDAFRAIPEAEDWDIALSVACGGMTLQKVSDCLDADPGLIDWLSAPKPQLPHCLETERFVLPFNQWEENRIRQVLEDVRLLAENGETSRARGLMEHWFANMSPSKVVSEVQGMTHNRGYDDGPTLAMSAGSIFEDWGALDFGLEVTAQRDDASEDIHHQATCLFEKGWITECIKKSEPSDIYPALKEFHPLYLETFEVAVEETAKRSLWDLVAKLLDVVKGDIGDLNLGFRLKAAYWALKSAGQESAAEWLEVLPEARTGKFGDARVELPLMIFIAKAIGWVEPQRDSASIASELADAITTQGRSVREPKSLLLPLRAAAMIGLAERMLSKGDAEGVAVLVPAQAIRTVIDLIWEHRHAFEPHESGNLALNLSFELVDLCMDIRGAHGEMVLSLAMSETEKFPVNQKMPVLWEVLRRAGRSDRLRAWAEHWLGESGAAWSGLDYSERVEIVGDLCRLCQAEDWNDIAETAEGRLRHHVIGYSTHKEYSFAEPLDWIRQLFLVDPSAWREEGLHLLEICHECDAQGGDNRLESAIENEVATAAFRCGPSGAYAFFEAFDPRIKRYWLQTIRTTLIAAIERAIREYVVTDSDDILSLWSCAVGMTRWFNKDQARTITALRDAILEATDSEGRAHIAERLKSISLGEFSREEYDEDRRRPESTEESPEWGTSDGDIGESIAELAQKVADGYAANLMEIGHLAMRVAQQNPADRANLICSLFDLVDVNNTYVSSWDYWGQQHPLNELIPSLRESEVWELVRAAVRTTGDSYWSRSVPHNVHLICLYRAASKGVDYVKTGAQSVFAMHRLWAGLPEPDEPTEGGQSTASNVDSWPEFVMAVLKRLLASDSAETVSSALRGMCGIAEVSPQAVARAISDSKGIERSRLLIGAEVWAARLPSEFAAVLGDLWSRRNELCLSDTIQLWICGLVGTQAGSGFALAETFMPQDDARPDDQSSRIVVEPKRLLKVGPKVQGSIRMCNAFSAASNWIGRLACITGRNTDGIETSIAEELEAQVKETNDSLALPKKEYFASEDGDMIITRGVDGILDKALLKELRRPEWHDRDADDVALAVTHGDDPWILRRSPLPSTAAFDWPDQDEINEWLDNRADKAGVLNRLRLLAQGDDLPTGEKVLGSSLRVFTSQYDLEMWYWLEAPREDSIAVRKPPLCPSSRAFQFFIRERYEPRSADRSPLAYFPGPFSCLSFSRLEVVPAKGLQDYVGWQPRPQDPLEWTHKGRVVARYEFYHGPLDYNWGRRNMRQPTLARWVVDSDAIEALGSLSAEWDHEVHPFSDG
jgi:hypothetical protein